MEYIIEEIESVEQLEDFDNEYAYDIEVDDDSHTFIANDILIHNSVYTTYGKFFECFTEEAKKKYDTDRKKIEWILNFNKEFLDKQNKIWLDDMYNPRHGNNCHEFELETISRVTINLKKKKYIKALSFNKGKFLDPPKISGTGIEIIKSTTPKLCREILTDLTHDLMFNFDDMKRQEYVFYFNERLAQWKKKFYAAPIEEISQSVGIGAYKKYVIDDTNALVFAPKAPVSIKCIARFNYMAHKAGKDNLRIMSGKVKYYNIRVGKNTDYFGFPSGELPEFAPPVDYQTQWTKTVIEPINRFLEVMNIPLVNSAGTIQMDLFGF